MVIRSSQIASLTALLFFSFGAEQVHAKANVPQWAEAQQEGIYRINAGQTRMMERFGVCRVIKNSSNAPIMVAARDITEWSAGANSFIRVMSNGANVDVSLSGCPDYFYILQGCSEADNGKGDCFIKPASKRTLTSAEVRRPGLLEEELGRGAGSGCRVGSSNWGDLYFRGDPGSGNYHPMGANDQGRLYFNDVWAAGGLYLDQNGSMVIPQKNFANKLFDSTVNYSDRGENGRMNRLWWDDGNLACHYRVRTSYNNGNWVEWGDYDAGSGKRGHTGGEFEGDNGASMVMFMLVRTPGVPANITDDVIDKYLVDPPPR